jgi:hypothetical protein
MQSVRDLCVIIKGVHGGGDRQRERKRLDNEQGDFLFLCLYSNTASSATPQLPLSETGGIEHWTVVNLALAIRRPRSHPHSARSHPQSALDLIHTRLDLNHNSARSHPQLG